mmetsp:Transcript_19703/g.54111  ORF Transcript_19703/g.54111 Transcript_19703/m.54111 type:complete len:474 (+) Transcript_19703:91-1512(+)
MAQAEDAQANGCGAAADFVELLEGGAESPGRFPRKGPVWAAVALAASAALLLASQFGSFSGAPRASPPDAAFGLSGDVFEHRTFQREKVADNMLWAGCDGQTADGGHVPAEFGGLWWIDGSSAPETIESFAHATWRAGEAACLGLDVPLGPKERMTVMLTDPHGNEVPCRGRLSMPMSSERIFAWPDTKEGGAYENTATAAEWRKDFVCGGVDPHNFTICKVSRDSGPAPGLELLARPIPLKVANPMVKVNDDHWIRYGEAGEPILYRLKRVVGCGGQFVEPHWGEYLSDGKAVPQRVKDVYDNGLDDRPHVSQVPELMFVRWNKALPPEGSGPFCSQFTGGTCNLWGCHSWRHASCVKREVLGQVDWKCECDPSTECETNGECLPRCSSDTGGTCNFLGCASWRGARCHHGKCLCNSNKCAAHGRCVEMCSRDTGDSCAFFGLGCKGTSSCEHGRCMCPADTCAIDGNCVPQ